MGCVNSTKNKLKQGKFETSKSGHRKTYLTTNGHTGNGVSPETSPREEDIKPAITERQKELVLESWEIVQADVSTVGVNMFMRLFETQPDVQDVFVPFKGKSADELKDSTQLKSHAMRVLSAVEKSIASFDNPKRLEEMLSDLGARHVMYNAKVDYIDLIGPQFIWAIEPVVGDKWIPEMEQAWSDLFKYISHIMKASMTF
ncbi:hypothetical protein SNE40_010036 [Patella caerulea]|uniref:Globin n=1 Tax=Patella caerulea TaxID=87958 RepID=A0AAN8Q422_PATCE